MMRAARTLLLAAGVLAVAAGALVAAGCDMPSTGGLGQVGGSGVLVTRDYDYAGFTKVVVDSGFDLEVDYADTFSVAVTVDDNLVAEHLKVELDGDTLHIGLAPLWRYHDVTTKARVALPRLAGLEASGASAAVVTGFRSDEPATLEASGASAVELAGVTFGTVTLEVSGASRVEGGASVEALDGEVSGAGAVALDGTAAALRLDASGGSRLELLELSAGDADLTLSGGSNGRVTVTGTLDAQVSGGSRLQYAGDPRLGEVDASGGSAVEPY